MEKKLSDEKTRGLRAFHRKTKDKKTAVRINNVILWAKGVENNLYHTQVVYWVKKEFGIQELPYPR